MNIWAILKSLKENYFGKKSFTVRGEECDQVLKVWNKFEMRTIKDYHDLYLRCNVLLLADVFEKVRSNRLKNDGLCLNHHLGAPTLTLHAMLNMTKIKLGITSDPDMYIFSEKDMRGWVSYIFNRYSKANNKFLKSYDPKQGSKHIVCLDANNLYGYAMSSNKLLQVDRS